LSNKNSKANFTAKKIENIGENLWLPIIINFLRLSNLAKSASNLAVFFSHNKLASVVDYQLIERGGSKNIIQSGKDSKNCSGKGK